MRFSILILLSVLLIFPCTTTATDSNEEHPNLSGIWTLNPKQSDDLQQVMMKSMGSRGGHKGGKGGGRGGGMGGGRGGGMGGGRGGGMGGSQGAGQSGPNSQAKARAEELKQEHSRLEIFQDGDELNVTNGLDITRLLHTDGRTENIWTGRGEAKATANWQDQILVVQWQTRQDTVGRIRRYLLSEDGRTMTVKEQIRLPGQKDMVSVRFVYNRQNP